MKKASHKSIRIFESPVLEKLTHVHPVMPAIVWGPVVIFCVVHSSVVLSLSAIKIVSLGFAGLLTWTLFEYLLHRFLFHLPVKGPLSKRFQFIMHGLHHEDPMDPTRLVMPPAAGIIIATGLFFIFRLLIGKTYVEPFFGFFLLGYLFYDYIHYFIHHSTPKNFLGRKIRSYHLKHHYASPDSRWGVSNPLWDFVFGTMGPKVVVKHPVPIIRQAPAQPQIVSMEASPEGNEVMTADPADEDSYLAASTASEI